MLIDALETCSSHHSAWSSASDLLIYMLVGGGGFMVILGLIIFGGFWLGNRLDEYEAIRRVKHGEKLKALIIEKIEAIEAERETDHDAA
jgi:uncharacterized membrane protein YciS (DUF1049 family)